MIPPLDQATFWICCSYYTYLRTNRRDWKAHTPFDRNHHRKCPEKTKRKRHLQGSLVAGRFLSLPPLDQAKFWICCSYYTYLRTDRRDWKGHTPFDRNHHRTFPEKQKGKGTCRAVWSPADFYLLHRWIVLIFGYVVKLDVSYILDGEDRKRTLWQGLVHVEQ